MKSQYYKCLSDKKIKEAIWQSYIEMMQSKIKPDDGYLIVGAKHIRRES
jgi:hypothetical protein